MLKKSLGMKRSHSSTTSTRRESTFMHIAFSIKAIADDVEREFKTNGVDIKFSERALTRVGQIVSNQLESQYLRDLYVYAKHAGRSIPTVDDVKLLYHRNPEIKQRVEELAKTFDSIPTSSTVITYSQGDSNRQLLNKIPETTPQRRTQLLTCVKPVKKSSLLHPNDDPRPGPHKKSNTDDFYNDDDLGIWAVELENVAKPNIPLEDAPTTSQNSAPKTTMDLKLDVSVQDWFQPDSHSTPLNVKVPITRTKVDDLITTLDSEVNRSPLTRKNIQADDSFYNDDDNLAWAQVIENRL